VTSVAESVSLPDCPLTGVIGIPSDKLILRCESTPAHSHRRSVERSTGQVVGLEIGREILS
jgi:hypothetical protein